MHVCTPLESHVSLAEQAIALGAHVVVEKPMTADAASTDALLAAAQARGVLAVPVHQFLFQPGVQRLLAARSRYGSLVRCVFEAATAGAEVTGLDRDELVAEILPHPLALFSRLTSSALSEAEWVAVRPSPGELRALADVDGTTFEIVISTRGRPTRRRSTSPARQHPRTPISTTASRSSSRAPAPAWASSCARSGWAG